MQGYRLMQLPAWKISVWVKCSRLLGCPHGAGSGHSLARAREAAQEERAANEGKGCLPIDNPQGLETASGAGPAEGLPHPLPPSLQVGQVFTARKF